jgi:histidinol-phosphate aminotransferase
MSTMPHTVSRRGFTRILGAGAAYAALQPMVSPSLLKLAGAETAIVRLSANENPYGPSPAAIKAMTDAFPLAWRYPDEHADFLIENLATLHDVTASNIALGNGSGEILKLAAVAFTGPNRRLVVADPTFEALARHAQTAKAETVRVPLTADYRHDLDKMLNQANAGLIYLCNPNNPTASITPKNEIRAFLAKVPGGTIVLVDEAYHHYVETNDYESLIPLLKQYPNVVVTRTFSKVYGMAGLRCGYCVASPELIRQMRQHQTWDNVNIMALVAATESLRDPAQVEQGRRRNSEVRKYVYAEIESMGLKYIPSQANFLMIDLQRPTRPVIGALYERKIEVGRVFPSLPTFLRVTIGTRPQMQSFVSAFREVMRAN